MTLQGTWTRYLEYLSSTSGDLPPGARAFATDSNHYDFHRRRCVIDLTLQAIRGVGGDEMEVEFQHRCWKHDQDLVIRHTGVSSFATYPAVSSGTDLGTVILDEVLPHRDGCCHR
ncbi:hypothetical protein [Streptomyces sp. NBC_00623]|uniref:hypothetical protein n=1 Tax=Streptomyces sp. NBC_00623 TaxID=2975790 RepID=UPI0030E5143F